MPTTDTQLAFALGAETHLSLQDFSRIVLQDGFFTLKPDAEKRLHETREFIDDLLNRGAKVYGLTTGFADLRNNSVTKEKAAQLSQNIIRSHDAGIGQPLNSSVTLGAMCLRAHSLAQGYSGFSVPSLQTLLGMIQHRIIPEIPSTGSLGASGDLAFLARLGRAMMGDPVLVSYQGDKMLAGAALAKAGLLPMQPQAKEGLALTNGTSFMASMLAHAFLQETLFLQNLFPLMGLFLNTVSAIDAAFYEMVHTVRRQKGQALAARLLQPFLPEQQTDEVQNDYCIRCLPQLLGPKLELIGEQKDKIERELNAVTDNPLLFRGKEISLDTHPSRILTHGSTPWAVVSGGNFHGENIATIADAIATANAKICFTLERQLTYLLNPFRNKNQLPIYLVADPKKAGEHSGHMITQYTANALTHKIALLAGPASIHNITSANESEDVVSYGATAAQKVFDQLEHMQELLSIYATSVAQGYSLARSSRNKRSPVCENLFQKISEKIALPLQEDVPFGERYEEMRKLLHSGSIALDKEVFTS